MKKPARPAAPKPARPAAPVSSFGPAPITAPVMPTAPTINQGASFLDWGAADPTARAAMESQWDANRAAVASYNQQYSAYQDQMQAREVAAQQAMMQAQMRQPSVATPLNPTGATVTPTGQLQATKAPVSVYGATAPKGAAPGILTTKKAGYVVQPGARRQEGARYGPYVEEQFRAQERQRMANRTPAPTPARKPQVSYY